MGLEATALAMLVALPGSTPSQAETLAPAIAEVAGDDRLLMAEIATIGFFESGFLERIQDGKCRKDECDHGRARTWFQYQRTSYTREAWELKADIGLEYEAVLTATQNAATVLLAGRKACHSVEGTLAFYATGGCRWSGARYRVRLVNRLMSVREG
jgi:hypothetical protein